MHHDLASMIKEKKLFLLDIDGTVALQQERQEIVQTLVENGMSVLEIANMLKVSEKDVLEIVKMK